MAQKTPPPRPTQEQALKEWARILADLAHRKAQQGKC